MTGFVANGSAGQLGIGKIPGAISFITADPSARLKRSRNISSSFLLELWADLRLA